MNSDPEFFSFPECIREYSGFLELPEEDKLEFGILLQFFTNLGADLCNSSRRNSAESFFDFIDNLELDLSVRIGSHARSISNFSSWLIHSSWAVDADRDVFVSLDRDLMTTMNDPEPSTGESTNHLDTWFRATGESLVKATAGISNAKSLSAAIAHQIAVDILTLKLLQCCLKCRINPATFET